MSRIITIEREFGSGGRELGKRLAEKLGIAYYDEEIIKAIAEKSGLAESYVNSIVERKMTTYYPISFGHTFPMNHHHHNPTHDNYSKIYEATHDIMREMAVRSDCVIVGRCSDYILNDLRPLKLFVYADLHSKMERCRKKAPEGEELTDKELIKQIKRVNTERKRYYEGYTYLKWGSKRNYNVCINTTGLEIKRIVPALMCFVDSWFENME